MVFAHVFAILNFRKACVPRLEVISMKDMLFAILALVAAIGAAFSFYQYTSSNDNKLFLVMFGICALAAVILGGLFLSGRVNKKEDIHITE